MPLSVVEKVVLRYSDLDILQRVAELLSDRSMAFKVDVINANLPPIDIGAVNLLNLAGSEINPATDETLQAILAALEGTPSNEKVQDYLDSINVPAGGAVNHDHTPAAGKTFKLEQVLATASGRIRVDVQVGPVSALVTVATFRNSVASPDLNEVLAESVEATAPNIVRLVKTNLEAGDMDVETTMVGKEA